MKYSKFIKKHQLKTEEKEDITNRHQKYLEIIDLEFKPTTNESEGLFGPNSMHWKIYRTPGIILGSYRALLLQIAHPAVADGVRQFSDFKADYLGRAERTFTNMIKIYFGDQATALKSGLGLHHMHNMIRGKVAMTSGGDEEQYCANDPELLLWVLATLIDTSLELYETICEPLNEKDKELFYKESKLTAAVMGIPAVIFPKDLDSFYKYYKEMLTGEELVINEVTKSLTLDIFKPPYFPSYIAKILAAGFLPSRFREELELSFTTKNIKHFNWIVNLVKWITRLTPPPLGYAPPYYQAHYRVAKAKGIQPKWADRFFNFLAKSSMLKAVSLRSN